MYTYSLRFAHSTSANFLTPMNIETPVGGAVVFAALAFLASGAYPFERLVTHQVGLDGVAGLLADPPPDYLKAAVIP